jgi:hypothetical protein
LFEADDKEDGINGQEWLYRKQIDTVTVHPPDSIMPDNEQDMAAGETVPEPKQVGITGLNWFIENDPIVRAEFTIRSWNPPGEKSDVGTRLLPFKTLDKAFIMCNKFIDELGIDARIAEKGQQTKIDRELLEEVDEWRQQNL